MDSSTTGLGLFNVEFFNVEFLVRDSIYA